MKKVKYHENIEEHQLYIKTMLDFEDSVVVDNLKNALLRAVKQYYVFENHTAKETCDYFKIPFTNEYAKLLVKIFPKSQGLGGSRKNAGNKKGVKFCKKCRKSEKNCTCNK